MREGQAGGQKTAEAFDARQGQLSMGRKMCFRRGTWLCTPKELVGDKIELEDL